MPDYHGTPSTVFSLKNLEGTFTVIVRGSAPSVGDVMKVAEVSGSTIYVEFIPEDDPTVT